MNHGTGSLDEWGEKFLRRAQRNEVVISMNK
jgi:hypothetical protein